MSRVPLLLFGTALAFAVPVLSQTPGGLAFEVSSVKPNPTAESPTTLFPLGPGDAYAATGGLFRATNQPLVVYLRFAYRLGQGDDLPNLPRWVYDERYDVQARASGEPTKEQMRLMMRTLLIDRFRLAVHTEQRTQPIYELIVADAGRIGPQMRRHVPDDTCEPGRVLSEPNRQPTSPTQAPSIFQLPTLPCGSIGFISAGTGDRGRIVGNGEPMDKIAEVLRGPFTGIDRYIRDRTGLAGTFDFSLEWSRQSDLAGTTPNSPLDDAGPRFQEALQTQLGLKLRSARGPVDVLVVDRVERPTAD